MFRIFSSFLIFFSLICSSPVFSEVKEVGKAAQTGASEASRQWQNWALAGIAVIIAAVGITLIAKNNGKSNNHTN